MFPLLFVSQVHLSKFGQNYLILNIIWWDLSDKTLWIPSRFIITPTCWQAQTCRKSIKWKLWKMWREKKTRFMLVLDKLWLSQTENSIFQELLRQFERYLYKRRSGGSMGFNGMRGRWELFPLQIFLKGNIKISLKGNITTFPFIIFNFGCCSASTKSQEDKQLYYLFFSFNV